MLQTTIRKALTEVQPEDIPHHRLYVVKDGDLTLYVGKSISPLNRLREHVGMIGRGRSSLGECLLYQSKVSGHWTYEALTVSDCKPLIARYDTMPIEYCSDTDPLSIDAAEMALILHYHPCLNSIANNHATPLPDKYKWYTDENPHSSIISEMLGLTRGEE